MRSFPLAGDTMTDSPASDGRVPLAFAAGPLPGSADPRRTALVLTGVGTGQGFAVIRHADGGARAQGGACPCCRVPSDLVTVLRRLIIERAGGRLDFDAVLVAGDAGSVARLAEDALADPFIAARYRIVPAPPPASSAP